MRSYRALGHAAVFLLAARCRGHGQLTYPPSRNLGTLDTAGGCLSGQCLWFSQPMEIPGEPTVNAPGLRTYNIHVDR
eukprot:gene11384-6479_t